MSDRFPNSVVRNYEWVKGDRLRILYRQHNQDDGSYNLLSEYVDVEILGTTYTSASAPDTPPAADIYELDLSSARRDFIYDEQNNKVVNSGRQKIIIPKINKVYDGFLNIIIEIYRPQEGNMAEVGLYKQFDRVLPILEPHTANRRHGMVD